MAYCFPKWPSQLHHLPGLCRAAGWESDHRRSLCPPSTPLLQGLWHIWSFRPWGGSAQWWPGGAAPKPTVRVPMFTFELKAQLFHISSLLWFNNIICHMAYDLNSLIVICFFLIELYLYVCIDIYTHTPIFVQWYPRVETKPPPSRRASAAMADKGWYVITKASVS